MLGEQKQTFFTVKDLPAKEFIEAFANYLKKNNFIERPSWVDIVKTGTRTYFNTQDKNLPPPTRTGSTSESHLSPAKSTSDPTPVSDCSPTSTEADTETTARPRYTSMPPPKSSDGHSNSWRSRNGSRRTRRETALSLTPAFCPQKVEESWTELRLSTWKIRNEPWC